MKAGQWWRHAVIYQVYPRSFQDTDGDGVGDLGGIDARLDYLVELGIDALWISPVYPSPMADFGYDVADYCGVDPLFGTLDALDRLLEHAHQRGLKVILDFVPNHSSDQHPWFLDSRSSRSSARRDWYLWRDPAPDGGPPNNWMSRMGGSAWQWDEASGQYYYHAFLPQQPDLNWRNPQVRQAMYAAMRFWLDRGVDGFRMDVIWLLVKDLAFRDNPPNPAFTAGMPAHQRFLHTYTEDQPETHQIVREMRATLDAYGDRLLIGEIYLPLAQLVAYYGKASDGAHLPFNFQLLGSDWNAATLARLINEYESLLPSDAWPNWVLGNHDNPRIASRVGNAQARVAAMLLLTLRGTPTLYYGDEIGMRDAAIAADQVQDPAELREPGLGLGRDPERTPMRWDGSAQAGFSTVEPWLPLGENVARCNVAACDARPDSILGLYRRLLALRRVSAALTEGDITLVQAQGTVLAYERRHGDARLLVLLNLGHEPQTCAVPAGRMLLSTHAREPVSMRALEHGPQEGFVLAPDEGVIIALSGHEGGLT